MLILDLIREYSLILKLKLLSLKYKTPQDDWNRGTKNTILLLPGFSETFVFLKPLADKLHELGYPVFSPVPINSHSKIKDLAEIFAAYIRTNKLTNIVCLSHSKGGLVTKYLMDNFPDINKRVELSISIATPYQGSLSGYLNFQSLFELIPSGKATQESLQHRENNHKIIALYSKFDNHVFPNKNLVLPDAKNIIIDIVGHTRILTSHETYATVKKILFFLPQIL